MTAFALTSDLMTRSQIAAAAEQAGIALTVVGSGAALLAKITGTPASLVVIDLASDGLEVESIVPQLREQMPDVKILAFGPHVHKARLEAASAAGCDLVMSRGQFHARMAELLGQFGP